MNIDEYTTTALAFTESYHRDGWDVFPWFPLVPIIFWLTIIVLFLVARRRLRGRSGEATLRDAYAKGDITEPQFRERLAVLRETQR